MKDGVAGSDFMSLPVDQAQRPAEYLGLTPAGTTSLAELTGLVVRAQR